MYNVHVEDNRENPCFMPTYEDPNSILLEKVSDNKSGILKITVTPNSTEEQERKKVIGSLSVKNWWLKSEWREKGTPAEQFTVNHPHGILEIYNFNQPLEQQYLDELREIIGIFSQIEEGKAFKKVKYILIDNKSQTNTNTGLQSLARGPMGDDLIIIFPDGTSFSPYRGIEGISTSSGALIHEFTHPLVRLYQASWREKFGWKKLDDGRDLPGGGSSYEETDQPGKCVTDYATVDSDEDICESMAAALRKPEILDKEKLQFLQEKFQLDSLNSNSVEIVTIKRKVSKDITLPRTNQPVKYKVEKEKQTWIIIE